jgi:predicted  nucleic acid-binding Zn-ribbon protein
MTDLHDLLVLQQHDTTIDQLRHRRATLPERALVSGIEAQLSRLVTELAAAAKEHDRLAGRQSQLEAEVGLSEDKRRVLERRLSSTSVPREAQTMSAEIGGLKERQSFLEDEMLEIMEALDPVDARLSGGTEEQAQLQERLTVGRAALAEAEAGIDQELATVAATRAETATLIPEALLRRYERLRTHMHGIAVATLDGPRCTGCNLELPTLELERVRAERPDVIIECEQCGRILVR